MESTNGWNELALEEKLHSIFRALNVDIRSHLLQYTLFVFKFINGPVNIEY